ncbi:MAG: SBBP repeat-containing protein [Bacteroidales bacterium]|nr:SBBP repeat-containing protein [Bacteroidales bacterium]
MKKLIKSTSLSKKQTRMFVFLLIAFNCFVMLSQDINAQPYNSDLQLNAKNTSGAPFISTTNSQLSMQGVMQNSKKDIVFIENLGQITDSKGNTRPDILFHTRSQGVDMYITNTGISYVFRKTEGDVGKSMDLPNDNVEQPKTSIYRLDMELVGINKDHKIKKELAIEQQFNYFTPEHSNGISPKGYKKTTIENVYDGIDLVYYAKEGKMKYDFVVKAGADPNNIKMKYKGAKNVSIDKDGNVIATTPMGEIREEKPYTYSRNTGDEIKSSYRLKGNVVHFDVAEYDKSEDIIIDPYRIWATYYGGEGGDEGNSICTDNAGNLYVTGRTNSTDFPTQPLTGAYNQTAHGGGNYFDAFILKFNSSGERVWATYYGGSHIDYGHCISADNSDNIYVTGETYSTNFSTKPLPGAYYDDAIGGYFDAFILKFNSSGERLWATYYGGTSGEIGHGICTDNSDNLYVTGSTASANFPTKILSGAYIDTIYGGGDPHDVFILKFDSNGTRLWATYYGGYDRDFGQGICTDNLDNLYVTGKTRCTSFPTQSLPGAYNDTIYGGGYNMYDAFILKFNSSCARLWATYYGGGNTDIGESICTDNSGNLYVTGYAGDDFPIQSLAGAHNQTTFGGAPNDVFILKFSSSSTRLWATYYGGLKKDVGYSICTDNSNNFYVTGETTSTDFPTQPLPGAYNQTTIGGGTGSNADACILKFNSNCARIWATYYGGGHSVDRGYGICTDNLDNMYVTGYSSSSDFPTKTLAGAYNDTIIDESYDAFILKFNPSFVGINNPSNVNPAKYSLHQNYPNPFNQTTTIEYRLPEVSDVKIVIFNLFGQKVCTLVNTRVEAGSHQVVWNGRDEMGSKVTSGVYFCRFNAGNYRSMQKMQLIQ